ncbi:hypothetical protein LTR08_003940 [Meristemomyces frigidus]|nr:hypothetical protein LTR08_003940 [Meristemomyces frigidus]
MTAAAMLDGDPEPAFALPLAYRLPPPDHLLQADSLEPPPPYSRPDPERDNNQHRPQSMELLALRIQFDQLNKTHDLDIRALEALETRLTRQENRFERVQEHYEAELRGCRNLNHDLQRKVQAAIDVANDNTRVSYGRLGELDRQVRDLGHERRRGGGGDRGSIAALPRARTEEWSVPQVLKGRGWWGGHAR